MVSWGGSKGLPPTTAVLRGDGVQGGADSGETMWPPQPSAPPPPAQSPPQAGLVQELTSETVLMWMGLHTAKVADLQAEGVAIDSKA